VRVTAGASSLVRVIKIVFWYAINMELKNEHLHW